MSTLIFLGFIVLSIALALLSKKASGHTARDFFVGSRQFGAALVFFLSAGEIYSISTMAGLPGGIYAKGPFYGVWLLGYVLLAYPMGYFLGPKLWAAGRRYDAATLPDLFRGHFDSRALEIIVAVTSILFLLPWGQAQFTGLIAALKALGWNLQPVVLLLISSALAFTYVAISGIRGSAYISILKDILMVVAIVGVGVAVAVEAGVSDVFGAAAVKFSSTMGAPELRFAMSTILLQSLGFYVLPFNAQNIFTANSENSIRKSLIGMPLYMLMFPFLILASYYAIGADLKLNSPNEAFFAAAIKLLPDWALGVIAAAASLSALVVLAGICLCISSILTKNIAKNVPEAKQRNVARLVIVGYLVLSIVMTLNSTGLMITLVNTAYNGITQFFPGVVVLLFGLRVGARAVACGMLAGQALSVLLYTTGVPLWDLSIGLVSLVVNVGVLLAANVLLQKRRLQLAK